MRSSKVTPAALPDVSECSHPSSAPVDEDDDDNNSVTTNPAKAGSTGNRTRLTIQGPLVPTTPTPLSMADQNPSIRASVVHAPSRHLPRRYNVATKSFIDPPPEAMVDYVKPSGWSLNLSRDRLTSLLGPLSRFSLSNSRDGLNMPVQVVSFHETLKCIAKVVVNVNVSVEHPTPVGYAHEWFAAVLIQKIARGRLHRRAVLQAMATAKRHPVSNATKRTMPSVRAHVDVADDDEEAGGAGSVGDVGTAVDSCVAARPPPSIATATQDGSMKMQGMSA